MRKAIFMVGIIFMFNSNSARYSFAKKETEDRVSLKSSGTAKKRTNSNYKYVKQLEAENKNLKLLAKFKLNRPDFIDASFDIKTGDMFSASTDLSVLSTNLSSPMPISLEESDTFPNGARVICSGKTYLKRIVATCEKIVTDEFELPINAILLDSDGTNGIRGQYYTGKEEYITGIIASEFSKGALSMSLNRIDTPNGVDITNDPRNVVLGGLINTGNEVTNLMKDEMQNKEPKVFVERGRKTILYFVEKVDFNGVK